MVVNACWGMMVYKIAKVVLSKYKKFLGGFLAISGAFLVLLFSFIAVTDHAFALNLKDKTQAIEMPVESKIDYFLPYPGILPDSPFYRLKSARDKLVFWSKRDALSKSSLELTYADKRLAAAQVLLKGGQPELAVTTLTKAEKYLERSVNRLIAISKTGKDVKSDMNKLLNTVDYHLQALGEIENSVDPNLKKVINESKMTVKSSGDMLSQAILEAK